MTQPRSRVDLYAAIRRDARSGMSNRALQRKHGVGFRTVSAALESAWPKERKQPPKRGTRLDAYRVVNDDWLRSDLDAPRKQRHTAKRIFDRLLVHLLVLFEALDVCFLRELGWGRKDARFAKERIEILTGER